MLFSGFEGEFQQPVNPDESGYLLNQVVIGPDLFDDRLMAAMRLKRPGQINWQYPWVWKGSSQYQ